MNRLQTFCDEPAHRRFRRNYGRARGHCFEDLSLCADAMPYGTNCDHSSPEVVPYVRDYPGDMNTPSVRPAPDFG